MKIPLIASSFVAAITIGPVGTYALTRESVQEKVQDHCLFASAELEGWKIAEEKLNKESSVDSLISPFKDLYNKTKESNYQITGQNLKNTCITFYSKDSSHIFKSEDESLVLQVKKYCSLTIKDRLKEENTFKESEENDHIQKSIDLLKTHDNTLGVLTSKLKEVKESKEENKKTEFVSACKELYESFFLSEQTNMWKLAVKYCKKIS